MEQELNCFFVGHFIPLQGIDVIIRAANFLRNEAVMFHFIGAGQTAEEIHQLIESYNLKNVKWDRNVRPYEYVVQKIEEFDVCLGIFSDSKKANKVIPNKIYLYTRLGKPIITAKTSAIEELFTDRHNILLCKPNDPVDLADKIRELNNSKTLLEELSINVLKLYKEQLIPQRIVFPFINALTRKIQNYVTDR